MVSIVTGGCGFIGSHLVESLHQDGEDIYVFDNLSLGVKENLAGIKYHTRFPPTYVNMERIRDVSVIYHLGMPSSSPMYKQNPYLVGSVVFDWMTILEYAKKNGCRIVFASSSSLYNGHDPPFKEETEILVTDYYTEARYAVERLAILYHRLHAVDSIGLRLFSVYGPRESHKGKYANCLTQFLWDLKNGKSPVIFGDGKQTRDLTYVSDVVNAFRIAGDSTIPFGIFNVGTGKATSFNHMVRLLYKELGTDEIKPEYVPNPISNYVMHTRANTVLARKGLGFAATVPLSEGIHKINQVYV